MCAKMAVRDENCAPVILRIVTGSFKAQKGKWLWEGKGRQGNLERLGDPVLRLGA